MDYPRGTSSLKIQLFLLASVNVSYSLLVCTAVGSTWLLLILVYGQDCPFINCQKIVITFSVYKENTSCCCCHMCCSLRKKKKALMLCSFLICFLGVLCLFFNNYSSPCSKCNASELMLLDKRYWESKSRVKCRKTNVN